MFSFLKLQPGEKASRFQNALSGFCRFLQTIFKMQTPSRWEPLLGRHLRPAKLQSSMKNTNIVSELDLSPGQMNSNADRKVNRVQTLVGTVAVSGEQRQTLCAASVLCCHKKCWSRLRHGHGPLPVCERPTRSSLLRLRSTKPNNYAQKSAAGFGLPLKSRRKKGSMQFFHESHDECEHRSNETGLLKWRGDVGGHEDASWNWNFLRGFLQSDDCMRSVHPSVVYLSLQRSVSRSWCM